MLGAIIGDIVGSRFEFDNTHNPKFQFFHKKCSFTDDTICTVAVADAILRDEPFAARLQYWCRKYPNPKGAYGSSFAAWINSPNPQPYHSYGNGAAMRVSPCGWAYDSEVQTLRAALMSAECSHNHPEGLIGASTIARAIFKLRNMRYPSFRDGEVDSLIKDSYGENYVSNIPMSGIFDETCQGCVPLAFYICTVANSFQDAIRKAVLYGGDTDTVAAIVGSLAEARWGIPAEMQAKALEYLPDEMKPIVFNFYDRFVR